MPDVPLTNKPYTAPYSSLGLEIVNNYYVENTSNDTTKAKFWYVGIPGLKLLTPSSSDLMTNTSACRGLYTTAQGVAYGVFGKTLVEISATGAFTVLGELNTNSGVVRFCDNSYTLLLVDGLNGYTVNIADRTFQQITEEYFPGVEANGTINSDKGPSHCACIDTYFIVNSKNTTDYYWSAPGYVPYAFDSTKPTQESLWNGLYFGQKIGDSDNIIGLISMVNLLWVFGRRSIEVHQDSQTGEDQTFSRMPNALVNFGCAAPDSICKYGNTVYWLGSDQQGTVGIFGASTDFQPKRISTRGIETRIASYAKTDDCFAYSYAHNGHAFIVFQFPSGIPTDEQQQATGATWVYDITNDTWTRRTYWDSTTGLSSAYRGCHATYAYSNVIIGDRYTNAVYTLDTNKYENDNHDGVGTNLIQRIFTSPVMYDADKNITIRSLQLNMQQGTGLIVNNAHGIGREPIVGISASSVAGASFGNERFATIGAIGQYQWRTRLTKWGTGRNRVFRFRCTAPVQVVVIGLEIEFEKMVA